MGSDARALATRLADLDDAALAETLAARGVSPHVAWHDFFDAAEALLDPVQLDRALTRLDRSELIALAAGRALAGGDADLLALTDADGAPYDAVADRIAAAAASRPDAFAPAAPAAAPTPADARSAAAAAERAFTTAGSLADVLLACLHTPLARTGAGAVSAVDRRRLTDAGAIAAPDHLEDLLTSAADAGLAVARDREWVVTDAGEAWLQTPTPQRWEAIAEGFRASLPRGIRTAAGGFTAPASWHDAYPLDDEWPGRADRLRRIGARWGVFDSDGSSSAEYPWTARLREGERADAATMAPYLPAEIDRVYLQADLTAIAPGPLAPALDLRLRSLALRESRAQASTYRFTAESLGAGMGEGETASSMREFLAELSLTGIPQPLEYLIESTASRHGLVRVRADAASGRTRVDSADTGLLDTIAVDQALRPLGLVGDGDGLTSRVARDAVYWTLADARYPVIAVDAAGKPEPVHRRSAATPSEPALTPAQTYERLLTTLRLSHTAGGDAGWLERELEQAVRARAEIVVVVRMPDGAERAFTLEASGLGGGRLRGRDRAADIERTLPVSSIVSVQAA
ncbi:helicase-associated domain-containing protein [Microbacterium jejuense]|uniref:Helicase-associated domain-containing protein n=1 Tax=Microbacterium jejuense TaxID=1263637 RepID=A0ABS7HK43_9MICO|nr:helicase-associated domain-containing protein [Microbacterium jejuense]MBW9093277.1 helicase-associated domain-containing protein [Microbacterium jejuense]